MSLPCTKVTVESMDAGQTFSYACNPAAIREVLQTLASKEAELTAREAEIANQALNYVSLFGGLQNAMAEIARLREVLMNVKATLVIANETKDGPIVDTIWHGPAETLFDYIDNSFTQQPTKD